MIPIERRDRTVVIALENPLNPEHVRDAVKASASDIHIEPQKDGLRVRFRLDGVLTDYERYPIAMVAL
jgi:type IV pilus assembly protein PilB